MRKNVVGFFQKTKPLLNKGSAVLEAGGFEPPSRDISDQTSTCVVAYLNLVSSPAKRQACESTSPQ